VDRQQFERILVAADASVREVIEAIDRGAVEIALAVDAEGGLIGTVTDGDIRRALLTGTKLDDPITEIIHREATTAPVGTDPKALLALMTDRSVEQVPLMDGGRVVDVATIRELVGATRDHGPVVIMAGGEGRRLRPLTDDTPKPMLKVGDKPLLEQVVGQIRDAGFQKVVMAVNYRRDMIEEHFGDGSAFGLEVEYVHEQERLGSAGALGLIRADLDRPFIVINADLLTKVNFGALARFHAEQANVLTVGVRQCVIEVPYGVVELDGLAVTSLTEKPSLELFVNAGIYAVSPAAVALMPEEIREFNMTDLIEAALAAGARVGSFPIREYWLDIGQLADYERAEGDHATYFSRTHD
jgi:dTDP-glucose pyrophosphorylase/predicted transcriptional regulator